MNKGIVMEIGASAIIVMTSEGRFAKIPLEQRVCLIGEEIHFAEAYLQGRRPWIKLGLFAAAAAVILLLLFNINPGSANKQIVAYVSIDINPSVEMGIDEHNIVLEIRGLNTDGTALIKNINYKGKNVDALTKDLLQEAEKNYLSKGQGDIIISSTMGENGNVDSKLNDVVLSSKLKEVVLQYIEKSHPEQKANFQVTAFAADKEVRKAAESKGLSAGKYTIYLSAKDNGQSTTIEDLKKDSVHVIAKKAGGIDQLIKPESLTKDKINKLLKDDESGDLDRKLINSNNAKKLEDKKAEDKKIEVKQSQDKQSQDKQSQGKQSQGKQSQDKQNQDKQNQDKQNQDKQNQDKLNQDKLNHEKLNHEKQNQDKQNQDKLIQDKLIEDKKNEDKKNQDQKNEDNQKAISEQTSKSDKKHKDHGDHQNN